MKNTGLSGLKSFEQYKSIFGSAKTFSMTSRPSSDSNAPGSFANLKLTDENLVKKPASVKTDLEMANSKLKKSVEHIRILKVKLQNALNESAKYKVKQKEDEKLWKGLESKFSSTKTLCDQLTETLQHLAGEVEDAEKDKEFFQHKLSASSLAIDDLNSQMNVLSLKLGAAEETIKNCEEEVKELRIEKDKQEEFYREEQCRTSSLIKDKDSIIKQLEVSVAANKLELQVKEDLVVKISALESENKDTKEKFLEEIEKKAQEIYILQKDSGTFEQQVDSLEKQLSQLQSTLEEKEQLILQYSGREEQLEEQKAKELRNSNEEVEKCKNDLDILRGENSNLVYNNERLTEQVKEQGACIAGLKVTEKNLTEGWNQSMKQVHDYHEELNMLREANSNLVRGGARNSKQVFWSFWIVTSLQYFLAAVSVFIEIWIYIGELMTNDKPKEEKPNFFIFHIILLMCALVDMVCEGWKKKHLDLLSLYLAGCYVWKICCIWTGFDVPYPFGLILAIFVFWKYNSLLCFELPVFLYKRS